MSFQDIQGHDNIKLLFKRALRSGRVGSAYPFFGPDGIGKGLTARTIAKALNCLKFRDDSCDECDSCVKISNNNHPDVMRIDVGDKKEAISIEQIREALAGNL